jgi:hypothetical protein
MLNLLVACAGSKQDDSYSDENLIIKHLNGIINTDGFRHSDNLVALNQAAAYIFSELEKYCDTVYYQPFVVDGKTYKNVIGVIAPELENRYVVGAHYDVCGNQDGEDDNASGVVGVLELARLFSIQKEHNKRIDFVAYTLEEPPYYGTKEMGSYIHAQSLARDSVELEGMICLEMIGYFVDEKKTQDYPVGFLRLFYGQRGDYITVVQKFGNARFGRKFKRLMKAQDRVETKGFKGPAKLPGVDFSDHRNYWKFGYDAVMITNTAFYRNKNYHQPSDTIETLDITRMAKVIDEVYLSLLKID